MAFFDCRIVATPSHRLLLDALGRDGLIAADHVHDDGRRLRLALTGEELALVRRHGIEVEIVEDLAATAAAKLAARARRRPRRRRGAEDDDGDDGDDAIATGFVDQYLDAAQVAARIAALAAEFPALCVLETLPEPTSGYDGGEAALAGPADVQLLRLSDDPADRSRPALLLICGTHAREWINPLIAIEFAEQLLRNHDPASADPEIVAITRILREGEVLIVPVMNPDGLNFSVHDDPGWRKNRRPNAGAPGCPGVDNNRNFEIYFGGAGSSDAPCSNTHRGPSAFSEPENRNIRHIAERFPNILIAVDSHSAGEDLFRPHATGGSFIASLPVAPEDEAIYQDLEAAANAAIQSVSGKTYSTGTTSNHAGASDEYLFFAHRVFAFDSECALSFQPPIASALVSVQEVTAALRALALKAIDLDVAAADPVRIVQAIDRTGSMQAFGYDDDARENAKRFLDLMSVGDSAALVSFADPSPDPAATPFADRARIDLPLTPLDPGTLADARAAVDALDFGGWTSLGAGLQTAAAALTPAPGARDAIVLLSDGFENRAPWTADVLDAFPAGLPVHTIALGPQSDIALLQQIAADTGGSFHLSPTAFDLYEVYNQIRADATDDDLVFNARVQGGDDDDRGDSADFLVEHGVSRLMVSIAGLPARRTPRVALIDPVGRALRRGEWGFAQTARAGHLVLRVLRPIPGRWRLRIAESVPTVVAAFVRSPLRIRAVPERLFDGKRDVPGLAIAAHARFPGELRLDGVATLRALAPWRASPPAKSLEWLDAAGAQWRERFAAAPAAGSVASAAQFGRLRLPPRPRRSITGEWGPAMSSSARPSPQETASKRSATKPAPHAAAPKIRAALVEYALRLPEATSPGVYRADLRVEGRMSGGAAFERVLRRSLVVPG